MAAALFDLQFPLGVFVDLESVRVAIVVVVDDRAPLMVSKQATMYHVLMIAVTGTPRSFLTIPQIQDRW